MRQRLTQGADRGVVALAQLAEAQPLVGFQHTAQDVLAHAAQHVESGGVLGQHVLRRRRCGGAVGDFEGHLQDLGHMGPQTPR